MTAAKSTTRRRRKVSNEVPRELADWFGGAKVARRPLLFEMPHRWQIAAEWARWIDDNPGSPPPAGWEWLADPADPRQRKPRFMLEAIARGEA